MDVTEFPTLPRISRLAIAISAVLSLQVGANEGGGAGFTGIGADAPAGFESFFTVKTGPIIVNFYGEELLSSGEYSYREATIASGERDKLETFFIDQGVKQAIATALTDSLVSGITSSPDCKGLLSECSITPASYGFVFDESRQVVRVFVNENAVESGRRRRYFDGTNASQSLSLTNDSNLYGQVSNNSSTLDWQNETTVSLPMGYFQSSTSLNGGDDSGFDVFSANYTYDMQGFSLSAGYDQNATIDNSAFTLIRGQNAGSYHATLFSNQRLAVRNSNRFDAMTVFVQETSELEIVRGSQVLWRGSVQQGSTRISYSTFPRGSYNVQLRYKVGGNVVREETRYIYNVPAFTMRVDEYDWFAQAGQYDDGDDSNRQYGDFNFARVGINGRFLQSAIVGAGYQNVGGLSAFSGSLEYIPNDLWRASLVATSDLNNNLFYHSRISVGQFYLSGEQLSADDNEFRSMFDNDDYSQVNAGFYFNLLDGSYNVSYHHYRDSGSNDGIGPDTEGNRFSSLMVTGNYQYRYFSLSTSLQYDDNRDSEEDDWTFGINVSVPFDHNLTLLSGYHYSSTRGDLLRNTLRHTRALDEQTDLSGELSFGNDYEDISGGGSNSVSGNLGIRHRNDYLDASGHLYGDNHGYNGSVNLSSSQLMDGENFLFTSERSDSYLVMDNASVSGLESGGKLGQMEIRNQSQGGMNIVAMEQPRHVIPMKEYSQYKVKLESGNARYVALGDNGTATDYFAKPGTFLALENNLVKINRYIVSFSNEQGLLAGDITCNGVGCGDVQEVVDSVYEVSVFEGYGFTLRAGDEICLLPNMKDEGRVMNLGRSLCMDEQSLARLVAKMPKDHRLYYLGATQTVSDDLSANTTRVKVGELYGTFMFAREEEAAEFAAVLMPRYESASVTPRLVKFPFDDTESVAAKEF